MVKYSEEVALLVAEAGPLSGQRWALNHSLLVGRDAKCAIVVSDRQVSRHHARINVVPEGISLEDLGSKNGTFHNGNRITDSVLLQDGDQIQIAVAQQFVYLSSDATVPLDSQEAELLNLQARDTESKPSEIIRRLILDKRSRRVWLYIDQEGADLERIELLPPLSVSQFRLLEKLYDNPDKVVPRNELVVAVWGENQAYEVSEQALDALVRRLRDRIAKMDPTHDYVITVRGHGLRLDNPTIDE